MKFWTINDGFDVVHKIGSELEKLLAPDFKQWVSYAPLHDPAHTKDVGRRGCCSEQMEWTRGEFLEAIQELPADAVVHHTESDGFGSSWGFYTYRDLTAPELVQVQTKLGAEADKREAEQRARFNQLLADHPDWVPA